MPMLNIENQCIATLPMQQHNNLLLMHWKMLFELDLFLLAPLSKSNFLSFMGYFSKCYLLASTQNLFNPKPRRIAYEQTSIEELSSS